MTAAKLIRLVAVNLRRDWRGALFSAFGVCVGIGALVFFVALGSGVGSLVRERIFPSDSRTVEVVAPSVSLGNLLGGGKLDEAAVQRLSALSGVGQLFRKMELRIPAMGGPVEAMARAFHVPRSIYIAVIAVGVEPSYVAKDLAPGVAFADPEAGKPIPALAARRLLELYNRSFTKAQGLPPIPEKLLLTAAGMELLSVRLGRSMRGDTGLPEQHAGLAFAGLSDHAPMHGVLIPIDAARRINREYGKDWETYSSVVLVARSPGDVPGLVKQVRSMGLAIDDSDKRLAETVGGAVAVTTGALALLSVLICLLAAVNIAHALSSSVRARSKEIGILRAVGATRLDVSLLVLGEAKVIGLLGGGAGAIGARLVAAGLDAVARTYLPDFPFKPETFFRFSPVLLVGATALGVVAALLGALVPALAASRSNPARSLA
jgi:hypothetical protein